LGRADGVSEIAVVAFDIKGVVVDEVSDVALCMGDAEVTVIAEEDTVEIGVGAKSLVLDICTLSPSVLLIGLLLPSDPQAPGNPSQMNAIAWYLWSLPGATQEYSASEADGEYSGPAGEEWINEEHAVSL
jgi:hypothetical protein